MYYRLRAILLAGLAAILLVGLPRAGFSAEGSERLEDGFVTPPAAARPWVYWFWLNGNITREGITADLEAMQRAGIGGVLIMEVDQGTPKGPMAFGSPPWRELFQHVCREADRLGLEVNMNNDAGWCGSGGPWITPELSMQKVVWSETQVRGPKHFDEVLPAPPKVEDYYRDIVVLAFPTPAVGARIADLAAKADFAPMMVSLPATADWPSVPPGETIPRQRVVDVTARMDQQGHLAWDVPEGAWTILRFGHTSTGRKNHPAPQSGCGLECDKLSPQAAEAQFAGLMGRLIKDVGPLAGKSLVATHIDSWEIGSQNWTADFRRQFQRRRKYDPLPYLPVMAGRIVESLEESERFLWDLRQTIAELGLENYAGHIRELAHRHGLRLTIEAYTTTPFDEMAYAGRSDEPMGEFWSWWWPGVGYDMAFCCTEMASAGHVYGRPIVGAEAFTATDSERWLGHPGAIKVLGDWAFCEGINRFVFHRYAMQPWLDRRPGMSMGPWGLHYERTQTWWETSQAWHAHLSRCQYLLQKGLFVADVCYLGPEGAPQTLASQDRFLATPGDLYVPRERGGYNFDTCPPEALLTRMSVENGRLVLPDGMSYRLLVLPAVETMTPQLLRKIKDLVEAGATVVGSRPRKSPSLSGYPDCDREVEQLADELFGPGGAPAELTARSLGLGRVYRSQAFQKKPRVHESAAEQLRQAQWIWHSEGDPAAVAAGEKRCFRRVVKVETDVPCESAHLIMSADNGFTCWINGQLAAAGTDFKRPVEKDVTALLHPGQNLVTVVVENGGQGPNPAALIGALRLRYQNGRTHTVSTDKQWECSAPGLEEGEPSHDSGGTWTPARELGPPGSQPWGDLNRVYGDTELFPEEDLVEDVLVEMDVPADFSFVTKSGEPSLRYIHRSIGEAEVYFVANKLSQPEEALCTFRVREKRPELWHPESGRIERLAVYDISGGMVQVPLGFEPAGSVFVVFRQDAAPPSGRISSVARDGQVLLSTTDQSAAGPAHDLRSRAVAAAPGVNLSQSEDNRLQAQVDQGGTYTLKFANGDTREVQVAALPEPWEIAGPWDVHFAPGGGAPEQVTLDKLISWSDHGDDGVRYYSGAATYTKKFTLPEGMIGKDRRLVLDLGKVEVMAQVTLNGRELGVLWKAPYRIDVTEAAKPGENTLEIKVINLWVNRQIGDEQLPEDSDRNPNGTLKRWPEWLQEGKPSPTGRYTFTTWRLWHKGDPLQPSGLLGPVRLHAAQRVPIE